MNPMDRGQDLHLQRIINNAGDAEDTNGSSRLEQSRNFTFMDSRPADFSFQPASRQLDQGQMLLSDFERTSYIPDLPQHSMTAPSAISNRLSFAPPLSTLTKSNNEPRALTNADNHFRFAQNLRQSVPVVRPALPPQVNAFSNRHAQSPLTQVANNMLLEKPVPQGSPDLNLFQGLHPSRMTQLQPRRQEPTPPFSLAGFVHNSNLQQAASSSPSNHYSSPTARVSERRAAIRVASSGLPDDGFGMDYTYNEPAPPETPKHQMAAPNRAVTKHTPQTLALGHAPPMAHGIQLVSPHQLPDRFRQVFPYELFNAAQSKCFAPIYKSNDNVVISAPTGSGKTALLELAICKLVEGHPSGQFKIVYQAPTKSLCSERMRDWQKKFAHLNLQCAELTGDTGYREMNQVGAASIIVTTPEKWDSITRKWKDYSRLLQLVKLFLIDEVHILKDTRGATLEAVVSRMKTSGANVRFIALSATVPNSQDIAVWLGKDHTNDHIPAHRETFGEDFRPVKLQKHVHGFDGLPNEFAFQKVLDGKLPNLIQKYTEKKPAMVFCFTRKSCEATATMLAEWWTRQRAVDRAWPAPTRKVSVSSKELQELVGCGVAFHHAGLDPQDRLAIESGFLKGEIRVICCTSTLAVGVNLPCHLVVLKGTMCFQDGNLCEYSDLEVMQMLGRAGRPQFEDSAVAIIMTRSDKADKYKRMISGQEILESTLHLNLIEHLNSEIGLGTVRDLYTAKKWLTGTFLSVRMRQNPDYYKFEGVAPNRNSDEKLEMVCERDIKLLKDNNLVQEKEDRLVSTEYGQAMSRYMVQFETMKLLLSLWENDESDDESDAKSPKTQEILHTICQASEFKVLRMKPNERSSLRELNKSPFMKYPVKENISTTAHKISLMIQVQLGGIDLPTTKEFNIIRRQFMMEKNIIFERVQRLIRCIVDCVAYNCDAVSMRHALDLARSLSAEYWENSNLQLRQITGIGPVAARRLVTNNINSIELLANQDTSTIERVVGKNPPFGIKLLEALSGFPRLTLASQVVGRPIIKAGKPPKVNVRVVLGFSNVKIPVWHSSRPSLTFMAETTNVKKGKLVHFWRGNISKLDKGFELKFFVELNGPDAEIKCTLACDEIVGTLRFCSLDPGVPSSAFPAPALKQRTLSKPLVAEDFEMTDVNEYGSDAIDEDELLAAVKKAEAHESLPDDDSDDFHDIDELLAQGSGDKKKAITQQSVSVKMGNGRWTCQHRCRGDALLKNGQQCKHLCCREGLDRRPAAPRLPKAKSSRGTRELLPFELKSKPGKKEKAQASKQTSTNTFKSAQSSLMPSASSKPKSVVEMPARRQSTLDPNPSSSYLLDVETVYLANTLSPVPYSKVAPRDYRKLNKLHESVQKGGSEASVRLPKHKPQFPYADGSEPDLPFLRKSEMRDNIYDPTYDSEQSDDNFPSPSNMAAYMKGDSDDPFKPGSITYDESTPSSMDQLDTLKNLEAGMLALKTPVERRGSIPKVNSSFANCVFDFDAFDDGFGEAMRFSSPLMRDPRKRERSLSPEQPGPKYRKLLEDRSREEPKSTPPNKFSDPESNAMFDNHEVESGNLKKHEPSQAAARQVADGRAVPDWVGEFDAELIESLMGIVDFVE